MSALPSKRLSASVWSAVRRNKAHLISGVTAASMVFMVVVIPTTRVLASSFWSVAWSPNRWWLIATLAGPLLLGLAYALNRWLKSLSMSWLEFSLSRNRENASLTPLRYRWVLSVPYVLLLSVCIPVMAAAEELIFRAWLSGAVAIVAWGGVVFGAIHLMVGVTVRMALNNAALGIVLGVVFAVVDSQAGHAAALLAVTFMHTSYNYTALALILYEVKLQPALARFLVGPHPVARWIVQQLPRASTAITTVET